MHEIHYIYTVPLKEGIHKVHLKGGIHKVYSPQKGKFGPLTPCTVKQALALPIHLPLQKCILVTH